MEKIEWCKRQGKGIKLRSESVDLAKEYIENAEESLRILQTIKDSRSNMWLATTKYYIEYFAVYAFLMRVGIKCEIHDCTIEFVKHLESMKFMPKGISKMLEDDKLLRIDNQYYLKNRVVVIGMEILRNFVLEMKRRIDGLSSDEIRKIRSIIS